MSFMQLFVLECNPNRAACCRMKVNREGCLRYYAAFEYTYSIVRCEKYTYKAYGHYKSVPVVPMPLFGLVLCFPKMS